MHSGSLQPDPDADGRLRQELAALALPLPLVTAAPSADPFSGRAFKLDANQKQMQAISFEAKGNRYEVKITGDTASYILNFGDGSWAPGQTTRSGPSLLTGAVNHDVGLPAFKTAGSYEWKDSGTLVLTLRYIEGPHTETMVCHVDGNNLTIEDKNSFNYGANKPIVITGVAR